MDINIAKGRRQGKGHRDTGRRNAIRSTVIRHSHCWPSVMDNLGWFSRWSHRSLSFQQVGSLSANLQPFADLPEKRRTLYSLTTEEMQHCQWVNPQLVAQIEFTAWTPDGRLRHASFAGLRSDKEPRSIVRELILS